MKLRICDNHQHYPVPLIWTYAFPGAEYWCPYCEASGGMLDIGIEVEATELLIGRLSVYREYTEPYLSANSLMCCAYLEYKEQQIKFAELWEDVRQEVKKISEVNPTLNKKAYQLLKIEKPDEFGLESILRKLNQRPEIGIRRDIRGNPRTK